ncbi:MAG TPA: hypothetical protein VE078_16320 [Thermoanaerobaculia bacterium]|nr:hypothetical protein [Thermoanaerobaculia bacterium]
MHNASYAQLMARWSRLSSGVQNFEAELPRVVHTQHQELQQAIEEVRKAKIQQLIMRAAYQQATRDMEAAMATAHEAASRIRCGVQAMYGPASEKLVAFGIGQHNKAKITARRAVPNIDEPAKRPEGRAARPFAREPRTTDGAAPENGGAVPSSTQEPPPFDSGSPLDGGAVPHST